MVFTAMLPRKLVNIRFALGLLARSSSGMTGRTALASTLSRKIAAIQNAIKEVITTGWPHDSTLPPRFKPRMRKVTERVNRIDPIRSKPLIVCHKFEFEVFARLGPKVVGVVIQAVASRTRI